MSRKTEETIFTESIECTFTVDELEFLFGENDCDEAKLSFSKKWRWIQPCDGKNIDFSVEAEVKKKPWNSYDLRLKFGFTDDGVKSLQGLDKGGTGAELIVLQSHDGAPRDEQSFDLGSIKNSEWKQTFYRESRDHDFFFQVVRHFRKSGSESTTERESGSKPAVEPAAEPYSREELEHVSDIDVRVGSKTFKCHRMQLAKWSSVFNAMFKHSCVEKETGIIQIEDFEEGTVADFISFLYEGRLGDKARYNVQLLGMANKYDVKVLQQACAKEVASDIKKENVAEAWLAAELYQIPELLRAVQEFLKKNWYSRAEMPGINDVIKNNPEFMCGLVTYLL